MRRDESIAESGAGLLVCTIKGAVALVEGAVSLVSGAVSLIRARKEEKEQVREEIESATLRTPQEKKWSASFKCPFCMRCIIDIPEPTHIPGASVSKYSCKCITCGRMIDFGVNDVTGQHWVYSVR